MTTVTITVEVDDLTEARRAALLVLIAGDQAPADPGTFLTVTTPPGGRLVGADPVPEIEPTPPDEQVVATPADPATKTPAKRKPGGQPHAILNAIADHGGTWPGAIGALVDTLGPEIGTSGAISFATRKLATDGLLDLDRISPHKVRAIHLTPAGWAAIERTPPVVAPEPDPVAEEPVEVPRFNPGGVVGPRRTPTPPPPPKDIPAMPELGPIEKRPFDPDAARAGAGLGVGW